MTKHLSWTAGVLGFLVLGSAAFAATGTVNMSSCPEVQITVKNVNTASGWGGHISLGTEGGFGGFYPECHLTPSGNSVVLYCYDGYLSSTQTQDTYVLHLGARTEVEAVTYTVMGTGVKVRAVKKSTTGFTSDRNGYVIEGFFPLRRESGFCSDSILYYQDNGVLNGDPNRTGSGYSISAVVF